MSDCQPIHVSVLADEVIQWLRPASGQVFLDGTLGAGGHTRRLAEIVGDTGCVIALDRDTSAITIAQSHLGTLPVKLVHSDFRSMHDVLADLGVRAVDGIVLDLGMSSDQLADASRGFSFEGDGELDLRFDTTAGEPAWKLLKDLRAEQLADLIYQYGEERFSRRIARRIAERRRVEEIRTASQLARLVRACVPRSRNHRIDPATRTFQALRIAVNDELGALEDALRIAPDLLRPGARLAVISFHSLEDRRVKHALRDDPRFVVLTKKPVQPYQTEIERNPRSRSAKMRVAERVAT